MSSNQQTLFRQWHMLRMLPRSPSKTTAQELRERLLSAGFDVSARTIQRDLIELAQIFPLIVDERSKPYGWSWHKDANTFDLPGLSTSEALTFILVEQNLQHQLPPTTLEALQPYFKTAKHVLANSLNVNRSKAWLNKVRTIESTLPLLPPTINHENQSIIYEALLQDRPLQLEYQKRGTKAPSIYDLVHPLAIVQRGKLLYLVCTFADHDDPRLLALHRVVSATLLYDESRRPLEFDIDRYLQSGAMGFCAGELINLEAIFTRQAGEHLCETPIKRDQILEELEDGRLRLQVQVPENRELLWWLLGLGDGVEVIKPVKLRHEIKAKVSRMAKMYL
ncbi:MAG: WYL domain-containing protein [Burkholderiales bacterium]|nr:WYL domain-containing protein [Burkholderiales bacterium]